jgi:hypothetical protein
MRESTAKSGVTKQQSERDLSRNQERAVVAMMAHPSIAEAAKSAGVAESSIWRWLQDESFQSRLRAAQSKVMDGALSSLQGAMTSAVDTLVRNLNCGVPAAENQAAKSVLDFTLKARHHFDYLERIRVLEAALRARERAEQDLGD